MVAVCWRGGSGGGQGEVVFGDNRAACKSDKAARSCKKVGCCSGPAGLPAISAAWAALRGAVGASDGSGTAR